MNLQEFIGNIYTATGKIELREYRHWALTQLQQLLEFDGAIWSNGHQQTATFHNQTLFNVPEQLANSLLEYLTINPLADVLLTKLGSPVDMQDLLKDEEFYQSDIYLKCFKPCGIERILSSIHLDERTGLFTLLTLYRFERDKPFSADDKSCQKQALYHLLTAANHALFLQLEQHTGAIHHHKAICDKQGYLHQVQDSFLDLLERHYPQQSVPKLPFALNQFEQQSLANGLQVKLSAFNDLYLVELWPQGPLDLLTERELQVVQAIEQGLTFKLAGKQLGLSPSTVSNHLYRIYQKLNIGSKSELIKLMQQ
ncbi:response regulator transcription factor [Thalassotalea sp. ND16A]|uniref:response regulator transcription factor n=1 Tax=Thalassotalea sp. ND16A TaxID=1535422 RepID=UPI00051A6313|nr:LuxR C-terminal-related transcriptional regulator [Thalassotalea sp. ND16A]KGJ99616.1 response regulator receiver protein [Thalassotalea sp. ND16A]